MLPLGVRTFSGQERSQRHDPNDYLFEGKEGILDTNTVSHRLQTVYVPRIFGFRTFFVFGIILLRNQSTLTFKKAHVIKGSSEL